jgi:hypothetical protein
MMTARTFCTFLREFSSCRRQGRPRGATLTRTRFCPSARTFCTFLREFSSCRRQGRPRGATLTRTRFCPSARATARSAPQRQLPPDEGPPRDPSEGGQHALVTRPRRLTGMSADDADRLSVGGGDADAPLIPRGSARLADASNGVAVFAEEAKHSGQPPVTNRTLNPQIHTQTTQ